jgi:hypothetical protein
MAAEQHDVEKKTHTPASHLKDVSANHPMPPAAADVTCSEDGSRCLSREEVRALSRRIVAERQRMIALLAAYDSQQ